MAYLISDQPLHFTKRSRSEVLGCLLPLDSCLACLELCDQSQEHQIALLDLERPEHERSHRFAGRFRSIRVEKSGD